jgi:hypothetical protein
VAPSQPADPRRETILKEVESRRQEAAQERQYFTPPADEPLSKDLAKPLIIWQQWTPQVSRGGTLVCRIGLANPSPQRQSSLLVHLFVGPPNIQADASDRDLGLALAAADQRFGRMTAPRFPGLALDSDGLDFVAFGVAIPPTLEKGNYLGNCVLFRAAWHGLGTYLERSLFVFEVV